MKKEVDFVERYLIEFGLRATFTGNLYHIKNEMISFMHQAVDRGVGHIRALVQQPLAFD